MDDERPWVERWVLPYLDEPSLRPVLIAILGHVVVVIVPLVLAMSRGSVGAGVAVAILAAASLAPMGFEVRHRRRPGAISVAILATWIVGLALAWLCGATGVL